MTQEREAEIRSHIEGGWCQCFHTRDLLEEIDRLRKANDQILADWSITTTKLAKAREALDTIERWTPMLGETEKAIGHRRACVTLGNIARQALKETQ